MISTGIRRMAQFCFTLAMKETSHGSVTTLYVTDVFCSFIQLSNATQCSRARVHSNGVFLPQGFMWDEAEELGAMLIFAEHRYYGESLPFGDESYKVSQTVL